MTTLHMELPPEVYRQLVREAKRLGKSPQEMAREWLIEQLAARTGLEDNERDKARRALQAAGLLGELSPTLRHLADPTVRLEDVRAALKRIPTKTLSEIILEQRGPRE